MTTASPAAPERRNHTLDLLRGLAILGVICVHCDQSPAFYSGSKELHAVFRLGGFGVQLFFFVSAITMALMWERRADETHRAGKFYFRRFLRIAPLFWLAIPFYLFLNGRGVSHWAPEGLGTKEIVLTALFLHGFWPTSINSVVPGGWSIAVEMTFYLVFPWIALKLGRKGPYVALAMAAYFVNLLLIAPLWGWALRGWSPAWSAQFMREFLGLQFFSQAYIFLLGLHLYRTVWLNHRVEVKREVLVFLGWFAAMGIYSWWIKDARQLVALFWIVCGYTLVTISVRYNLRNRVLEALGRKSYSMYLAQFAVLAGVETLYSHFGISETESVLHFFTSFLLVTGLTYLAATVLYYAVEQPLHRLAIKVTHHR